MPFGQIVIGPPGSGKTTYCHGVQQLCQNGTHRKVAIVNLDPANENLSYEAAVDISDLVHLAAVMEELKLGPNGGLVYCIDYLEKNMDWLKERLELLQKGEAQEARASIIPYHAPGCLLYGRFPTLMV
jgi:GTPase SAR1 family protein